MRIRRLDIHADKFSRSTELAKVLAQGRNVGCLPHGHGDGATHGVKRLLDARIALQHLNYMKAKTAVYQTCLLYTSRCV